MSSLENVLGFRSIKKIEEEISKRRTLRSEMVGQLYPSILNDEIYKLNMRCSEIRRLNQEGWSDSIISRTKVHYYKDGLSLCGKKEVDNGNRNFEIRTGSKYFDDCQLCIKKLKQLEI